MQVVAAALLADELLNLASDWRAAARHDSAAELLPILASSCTHSVAVRLLVQKGGVDDLACKPPQDGSKTCSSAAAIART